MKNTNTVIKISCLSRKFLLEIHNACCCKIKENFSLNKYVEDSRQHFSGMTPNFTTTRAFTLIELLVVVLIIGILAAVAVPQYQKVITRSRLATLKNLVQTIANAQETYYLAHGDYADKLAELDIDIPTPSSTEYIADIHTDNALYPWGICYLSKNGSNRHFQCNDMRSNIGYIQRFLYSPARPGTRACTALNNTQIALNVCKQETGANTSYSRGDSDKHGNSYESFLY